MPRLSIIVPVYKVEQYLNRCIDSILLQTYRDFELILVDDGSPDNSGKMCDDIAKTDKRIKVIHKENGGLSSARNTGLDIASGDYVGFIDSDDWVTKDMFEHLISLADSYNCEIASASYVFSNGETTFKQPNIEVKVFNKKEALRYYMLEGMSSRISDYPVCIKIYKKILFDNIRFPEGQLYEDVATNFILIQKSSIYVKSNKICYYYFQDGGSITRSGFKNKDMDILKVGEQLVTLAEKENDEELLKLAKMKSARSYFSILAKIAAYGIAEEIDNEEELINNLTSELRKNYIALMKSTMPMNRKLIMNLLCININCVKIPIKTFRFLQSLKTK